LASLLQVAGLRCQYVPHLGLRDDLHAPLLVWVIVTGANVFEVTAYRGVRSDLRHRVLVWHCPSFVGSRFSFSPRARIAIVMLVQRVLLCGPRSHLYLVMKDQ